MATLSSTLLLKELSSIIQDANEMLVKKDCIRDLISFLESLKSILHESLGSLTQGNLVSLGESLKPAQQLVNRNKCKRRLYWIICLHSLNQEVEEIVKGIENSLQSINLSAKNPDLQALTEKMQQVHYEVLDGESEINTLLALSSSNLMIRLAQDLGINFERDRQLLSRELRYLKVDITMNTENTQQWQKLTELVDDLLDTLACENSAVLSQDEDNAFPLFGAFECPLTKVVMKDPVVIQSEHTYERQAIEQWFTTCRRSKREPTCPITGMVLTSTDLHSNHVLRKAIEEWYQRNVAARIEIVRGKLKVQEGVDDALDEILKLANENPLNKFQLKEAGLIPEIAKVWSLEGAAYFRAKALAVLEKMVVDDVDNKVVFVKEGLLRSAVRSLGSREDEEKANAAKLLYTLSENDMDVCAKLGGEKGAIIHLVGLTASKTKELADVAEKTLKNLEKVNSNVLEMAEAGLLQPLLTRLCEGPEEVQIEMAKFLAKRHLVKSQKKLVAQTGCDRLIAMLSGTVDARVASLEVFQVLVTLAENRSLLLKDELLLSALLNIMFNVHHTSMNSVLLKLKENAATIVSKLVSAPGHWEHTSVDSEGNTMHSETVIHNLLGLLMHVKPNWKATLLEVLTGLASSPEVADETCSHIRSGNGIRLCFESLSETAEASQRLNALKLLSAVSARLGPDIVLELNHGGNLERLKQLVLKTRNKEECAAAAYILGNIPLTSKEVSRVLVEPEFIRWTMQTLDELQASKHRSATRVMTEWNEGLLGILVHVVKLNVESGTGLMNVLVKQLERQGQFVIKQRAALTIKHLSEKAPTLTKSPVPPPGQCFCFSPKAVKKMCPVHSGICDHSVCMIECKVLPPLLELLDEEDEKVQLAALDALSTLLGDDVNLQGGVEELAKADGLQKVVDMFSGLQRGEVQDRTMWMIERIVRVEEYAKSFSVDTKLFKSLVEAFKFGSSTTKRLAQEALTSLKQLSGVSAGNRVRKHK